MGRILLLSALVALFIASAAVAYVLWTSIEADIPPVGYLILGIGMLLTILVGSGLMALLFYSSRRGYDEAAGAPPELERED